jgi:hypothetical protein
MGDASGMVDTDTGVGVRVGTSTLGRVPVGTGMGVEALDVGVSSVGWIAGGGVSVVWLGVRLHDGVTSKMRTIAIHR